MCETQERGWGPATLIERNVGLMAHGGELASCKKPVIIT